MAREDDDDYDQDYVPRSREVHSAPEANLTDLRSLVERRSLRRPQILATQWSPEFFGVPIKEPDDLVRDYEVVGHPFQFGNRCEEPAHVGIGVFRRPLRGEDLGTAQALEQDRPVL
jgi:hypothetical protein